MGNVNPYLQAWRRIRRHRGQRWGFVFPVLAVVLALPYAQPALLGFLERDLQRGLEAVTFRLGLLMAALMSIHTYTQLVRSPDRTVLDPHPVQARALMVALLLRTARERAYLPLIAALLLAPLITAHGLGVWGAASVMVLSCWWAALALGFAIHLGSVWAAFSPSLALVLDLLRGDNPRMQASLIYAPGVVLAVVGVLCWAGSLGVGRWIAGKPDALLWMSVPVLFGAIGALVSLPLAERYYVRATALLVEVDAMWAGVEEPEEELRVYLEWVPPHDGEVLRTLRQGWRRLRSWPTGAWLLGVACAAVAWSTRPETPVRVGLLAAGGAVLITALPTRLAEGDPQWLDEALGVNPAKVAVARAWVSFLYAQGVLIPPFFALWLRHDLGVALTLVPLELFIAVGAVLAALLAWRWRDRSIWAYGGAAMLLWTAFVGGLR